MQVKCGIAYQQEAFYPLLPAGSKMLPLPTTSREQDAPTTTTREQDAPTTFKNYGYHKRCGLYQYGSDKTRTRIKTTL
ncbi:hypothetical protein [Scytonema sp. HK-05]|uniref:hypothetical protein n=1 Tax=Scytonema sp. HK-05 TaxID=1137095 RepID=UPI000935E616|nr:hypothetical protein [Scytonema sp. HK-05]